jgi:hypothetical protein
MASPWIDPAALEARREPLARLPVRAGLRACARLPGGAAVGAGRSRSH